MIDVGDEASIHGRPVTNFQGGGVKLLGGSELCENAVYTAKLKYFIIVQFSSFSVQFSSVQFSFISAPPHEQNNKMLKSLCVVKDGVRKRKKQQNELTLCLAN